MEMMPETNNRKRFLLWGIGVIGAIAASKILKRSPKKTAKTARLLTQDGKLVEIPEDLITCGKRKKISDEQLQNWIKK